MTQPSTAPAAVKRPRDIRLDFFRGLALFIILISHMPKNAWANWIPGRFGFSDSAEIFVFCSGMAAGFAYGPLFDSIGWLLTTAKIVKRAWQLYWAQIAVFATIVALLAAADHFIEGAQYVRVGLYLGHFVDDPGWMFARLFTLTYVPNYFDILPMYLGILLMLPLFAAVAAWSRVLAASLSVLVWIAAGLHFLDLSAEPWSDRTWFFNPFAWQLVFFSGYAIARGWLRPPSARPWLIAAALAIVAVCVPLSCQHGFSCNLGMSRFAWLQNAQAFANAFADKTHLGPLRYLHFLALAYLANAAVGDAGRRLRGPIAEMTRRTGRETLPVFLASLVLSQFLGIFLDVSGHNWFAMVFANVGGCGALVAVAYVVQWFKREPWRARAGSSAPKSQEEDYRRQIAA